MRPASRLSPQISLHNVEVTQKKLCRENAICFLFFFFVSRFYRARKRIFSGIALGKWVRRYCAFSSTNKIKTKKKKQSYVIKVISCSFDSDVTQSSHLSRSTLSSEWESNKCDAEFRIQNYKRQFTCFINNLSPLLNRRASLSKKLRQHVSGIVCVNASPLTR